MSSLEAVDGFKLELDLVQKIMKHYTHLTNSGKTIIMCPWAIACIICVILRLAILIQYRSLTDTHIHTDT